MITFVIGFCLEVFFFVLCTINPVKLCVFVIKFFNLLFHVFIVGVAQKILPEF
jgi:hypothetical protein